MFKSCLLAAVSLLVVACGGSPESGPAAITSPSSTGGSASPGGGGPATPPVVTGPFKVLLYSRTDGFRHASIPFGIQAIQDLGTNNDFTVDATEDPTAFTDANLAQYELVIFLNTTSNVLDPAQEMAFENFIMNGGNFVGIHSAADTEHDWPFYGDLVGAYFLSHPVQNQAGTLIIEDQAHPSMAHLPTQWQIPFEEFYSFKTNPRDDVRVLARIDEDSYQQFPNTSCDPSGPTFPVGYSGVMGDHPMVWCHDRFPGRAWYTALGHEAYLYQTADFQALLLQGILVATKRVAAQCAVLPPPANLPPRNDAVLEDCQNQVTP